ncbi:MAG: T9SS type A sorting domain-containing protein [Saprospiraceae bacterium]
MKWTWFTRLLLFAIAFNSQLNLSAQNVILTTQAEVDAFTGTKINGFLLIKGDEIMNLHNLSTLDSVMGSVFIEYNRKLKDLDGLDSLLYIKKTLLIEGNTELDSINAFGLVKKIGGPLILRKNFLLEDCCAFYPLLQENVIKGGTFIDNNKACKSEKELRENCDSDTDKDGKDDTDDGCPNDPNKTQPGVCGCGVAETDSDNDGTPDCNDKCPNDPAKIAAGNCGCGTVDKDSDNDGVADCKDECPYNADITEVGFCGCEDPKIINITIANIGECDDRGTASSLDDTYTVDVTVTFERVPTSGTVLITGHTNAELNFSSASTATSYTLFDLPFVANGRTIEVIAAFKYNENCRKRSVFYGNRAPQSCSTGACDPPSNSSVNTENYLNGAFVSWPNLGIGVVYELEYRPVGAENWVSKSIQTNELLISDLAESTTYEYRIRSICDGQRKSAYLTSQFTTISKECTLTNATIQNVNCQDNGTPTDASDDYLTFDLIVTGINVSNGFSVNNVMGAHSGEYNTVNSYSTAMGTFEMDSILLVITDNADSTCQLETILVGPESCDDDCQISSMSLGEIHSCHEGSRFTLNDDFVIADVIVNFKNVPEKGHLRLEAGRFFQSVNVSRLQGSTSYTFRRVIVPTTGKDFSFKTIFSKEKSCVYTGEFTGLTIQEDKLCGDDSRIGIAITTPLNSTTTLAIYPNPANETLFLNYQAVTATPVIEIFDLLGQQVMHQIMEGKELNIGHLEKGLYHLVIRDGQQIQTKKFIKD